MHFYLIVSSSQVIDLTSSINFDDDRNQVPPLVLIYLVENAFKLGIEPFEKDGFLHITLSFQTNVFEFHSKNSVDLETASSTEGIGLKNLRRRLEIRYPGKYVLENKHKTEVYSSCLRINLDE